MIALEDRQSLFQDIGVAHATGARLHLACEIAGIDLRTLQRWKAHEEGLSAGDGRAHAVRPLPSHALSEVERAELVRVANGPRFAAVPPARIGPCWPTRACTWPASPPSAACCAMRGRQRTAVVPRSPGQSDHRPRTWPRRRDRCGAGT